MRAAAAHAAARERRDYADAPREKPFIPLAVEIFGCIRDDFQAFLTDCALRATESYGIFPDLQDPALLAPTPSACSIFGNGSLAFCSVPRHFLSLGVQRSRACLAASSSSETGSLSASLRDRLYVGLQASY